MLDSDDAIAVVGLAARVPGAATVDEFWLDLIRGHAFVPPISGEAGSQALFLEVAKAAVENAGYDPATIGTGAGVYAAGQSPIAEAVSRGLDLHGPSLTVLGGGEAPGAPGALVALQAACQSLRVGDCDVAITGGLTTAAGAACVMVIKRLADALADRDRVRAVIRGIAVGHDGAGPNRSALTGAVLEAMATAGVMPDEVSYVEARGDTVEVAALTDAYTRLAGRPPVCGGCGLGSMPGDLGPITGFAGLMKVVLALDHEQLPAGAGADEDPAPFLPQDRVAPWPRDPRRPRVAAVGSSGGGISVHVVLAEAPARVPTMHAGEPRVLLWSGHSSAAERSVRDGLAQFFVWRGDEVFADAVATLQHGRARHAVRAAAICTGALDAVATLGSADAARVLIGPARPEETRELAGPPRAEAGAGESTVGARPVVLYFPGTGHPRAVSGLYRDLPAFARALDGWLERLDSPDLPVWQRWRDGADDPAVLFAVEAALAELWTAAGVRPAAVVGDGIGVLAAALTAGTLRPAEAAVLVHAWVTGAGHTATIEPRPAVIPLHSTASGHDGLDLTEPAPAAPERLDAVRRELPGSCLLIEVGPGQTWPAAEPTVPADGPPLLRTAATLWTEGHDIDWETVGQAPLRCRADLPAYPNEMVDAVIRPLAASTARDMPPAAATTCSIVVLEKPGTGPLVLGLPYAGASGRALQTLRHHLPEGAGFALVDLPGHGARMGRPCLRDPDAVVDLLLEALPSLPSRRLVLFGYSLGGAFAYELAARLAERGTPPEGLVICGTRALHTGVGHPPIAHLTEGGSFLNAAVAMGLAAREMVELPELAEWCAGPLQADLSMVESFPYRPRRAPVPVPTAIIGMHGDWLVPEPSLRAWDDLCLRPPLQIRVPGGHLVVHEREREFGETVGAAIEHLLGQTAGRAPSTFSR